MGKREDHIRETRPKAGQGQVQGQGRSQLIITIEKSI